MKRVYLAGGCRPTELRGRILGVLNDLGYEVLDPATHGLVDERDYTAWDLNAIDRSELVVAFMEPCNPSGYGLTLEVGYAKAKGMQIVFIDALGDDPRRPYFGMVRASAGVVIDSPSKLAHSIWILN